MPGYKVKSITGALGIEISGVDLAATHNSETIRTWQTLFDQHHVLVFRQQSLTPRQHNDFACRFYRLDEHPYVHSIDGFPGIIEIVKEPDETRNWGGFGLHMDLTFREMPPAGAALHAREVPPAGGDTLFVNMQLAYDTLSSGMKKLLCGLETDHESFAPEEYHAPYKGMYSKGGEAGKATHPIVIKHPATGRLNLYVNPTQQKRFKGMSDEESAPLLTYLFNHVKRPEFSCRIRWEAGTLIMWNNMTVLHCAINDDFVASAASNGYRRVLHRATFAGIKPSPA